jgi:uncharacterized protein
LLCATSVSARTTFISIGTGGTGGIYYPYGGGVAEIWSRHVPGVRAVAEVTGASVENIRLAHRGETVVGLVMGDVSVSAYEGGTSVPGQKAGRADHGRHVSQLASSGHFEVQRHYRP